MPQYFCNLLPVLVHNKKASFMLEPAWVKYPFSKMLGIRHLSKIFGNIPVEQT